MKKAQISFNYIVAAALSLLVLIVLALIFSGRINILGNTIRSCKDVHSRGECDNLASCQDDPKRIVMKGTNCDDTPGQVCCIPLLD